MCPLPDAALGNPGEYPLAAARLYVGRLEDVRGALLLQDGSMSITKERKTEIINEFQRTEADTGSPEVQVAMLTHRINELTSHLNGHKKDHSSRRGLLMLVSRRRRLLDYLRRENQESYLNVIGRLSLRK
jgi:small subunit ribosomal protein S15